MTILPATRAAGENPTAATRATIPITTRIANLPETVASKGVELTVVLSNSPGAGRDAGEAFIGQAIAGVGGGAIGQNAGVKGAAVRTRGGWGQINLRPRPEWMASGSRTGVPTLPPARADAFRAGDTPFWNGAPCATESEAALSPPRPGSALARRLSSSPASGSCAQALPYLPGVVARVDEVEAHPLLDGQIAHAGVLHEQIRAALGQQRAVDLIPGLDRGQEMRLGTRAGDLRCRRGAFGRLA